MLDKRRNYWRSYYLRMRMLQRSSCNSAMVAENRHILDPLILQEHAVAMAIGCYYICDLFLSQIGRTSVMIRRLQNYLMGPPMPDIVR